MKIVLLLSALIVACSASQLEIVATPSTLKFPDSASTLKTTQLSSLNEYLLGLSSRPIDGFNVEVDIFSRPRALAIVNVEGVDSLNMGKAYSVNADGVQNVGFEQDLALVFGSDRQSVQLTSGGISGSQIALAAQQQVDVDTSMIKTKLPTLRRELELVYKLIGAIKAAGTRLENSADVYQITISGLAGLTDESEKKIATEDIKTAIAALSSVLNTNYGGQALVEVLAVSGTIQEVSGESEPIHRISKREATDSDNKVVKMRKLYQVAVSVSSDYPAIFAIFFGLVVVLVVALIYIVAGMVSIDPEKDSIIYRMTTTRMKKD